MTPTIDHFNYTNAMLNRWPILSRRTLNRSATFSDLFAHPLPLPFYTWV
jgi:hypothetical protein